MAEAGSTEPKEPVEPTTPPTESKEPDPAPVTSAEPADDKPPPVVTATPKEDWRTRQFQRRIDALTARAKKAEDELANKQATTGAPTRIDEAELARLVEERVGPRAEQIARELSAQREFDRACNSVVTGGRETYGQAEFDQKVKDLKQLAGEDAETKARYDRFVADVVETGDGAKLIYLLAEDLDEASRIMDLSPVKRGVALAKLAGREIEPVTTTPKPITPLKGKARSHTAIEPEDPERAHLLSSAEWMARRIAHVEAQQKERGGRR